MTARADGPLAFSSAAAGQRQSPGSGQFLTLGIAIGFRVLGVPRYGTLNTQDLCTGSLQMDCSVIELCFTRSLCSYQLRRTVDLKTEGHDLH